LAERAQTRRALADLMTAIAATAEVAAHVIATEAPHTVDSAGEHPAGAGNKLRACPRSPSRAERRRWTSST
jgi:hypothetical protein